MNTLPSYVIDAVSKGYASWRRANCPFCEDRVGKVDKDACLAVNVRSGVFMCWRCGVKGHDDAAEALGEMMPSVENHDLHDQPQDFPEPEGYFSLGRFRDEAPASLLRATRYLNFRRVDHACWGRLQIGATIYGPGLWDARIIVPIISKQRWRGYVGRDYSGEQNRKRYLYPAGMDRGSLMFNMDWLVNMEESERPAVVVEGVFDALPHYPWGVACLGKPTRQQYELLLQATRPIVVALDRDAMREGEALANKLVLDGKRAYFLELPRDAKDPGEMFTEDLLELAHRLTR